MKVFTKLFIFLSLIFSIQSQAQISSGEIDLKVQSRVGRTYIGVLKSGKLAAIVCSKSLLSGWSADLVFSVQQVDDKVPELTLETYRATRFNQSSRQSPYVQLSSEAATQFCENPMTEVAFRVGSDRTAFVSRVVPPSSLEASSDR